MNRLLHLVHRVLPPERRARAGQILDRVMPLPAARVIVQLTAAVLVGLVGPRAEAAMQAATDAFAWQRGYVAGFLSCLAVLVVIVGAALFVRAGRSAGTAPVSDG